MSRVSRRVRPGDQIVLVYGRNADRQLVADDLPISILHEDDDLIVVDKPSGVSSQPRHRHVGGSMVNRLVHHLSAQAGEYCAPRVVHRLDYSTTGVVLYAKSEDALRKIASQFRKRTVEKYYYAIVGGAPSADEFTIDAPIGRDPLVKEKRQVREDGKASRSHVRVLERFEGFAALEVRLETGRTHQIRVHLDHVGHAIASDDQYGDVDLPGLGRTALHAWRLGILHPSRGVRVLFEAPIPADLLATRASLAGR